MRRPSPVCPPVTITLIAGLRRRASCNTSWPEAPGRVMSRKRTRLSDGSLRGLSQRTRSFLWSSPVLAQFVPVREPMVRPPESPSVADYRVVAAQRATRLRTRGYGGSEFPGRSRRRRFLEPLHATIPPKPHAARVLLGRHTTKCRLTSSTNEPAPIRGASALQATRAD